MANPTPDLGALLDALHRIAPPPRPDAIVAVWYVDRPGLYGAMEREIDRLLIPDPNQPPPIIPLVMRFPGERQIGGVVLKQWLLYGSTPEEWARLPDVCKYPGVWCVLANGAWGRVSEPGDPPQLDRMAWLRAFGGFATSERGEAEAMRGEAQRHTLEPLVVVEASPRVEPDARRLRLFPRALLQTPDVAQIYTIVAPDGPRPAAGRTVTPFRQAGDHWAMRLPFPASGPPALAVYDEQWQRVDPARYTVEILRKGDGPLWHDGELLLTFTDRQPRCGHLIAAWLLPADLPA